MDATTHCSGCHGPLPVGQPGRLCSRCLAQAMQLDDDFAAEAAEFAAPAVSRFGDYEVLGEIARGGMGVVYRARQTGLNREVALKVIANGLFASEAERRRFRAEAEAVAQLDHPNIVPIHEVGEHEGRPFFTMKLIEGGSLARRMSNDEFRMTNAKSAASVSPSPAGEGRGEGKFSSGSILDIRHSSFVIATLVAKIARAVHYAHQRGILHRDLKPANILLDAHGEPFVTDFGLAKKVERPGELSVERDAARPASHPQLSTQNLSQLTVSGAALGTPNYMAPEQARGGSKSATTAADIYSLGAILYELLCGRPPFAAATPLETMRMVVEQDPVPPSRVRREVSSAQCSVISGSSDTRRRKTAHWPLRTEHSFSIDRDLETICLKCLEKDPARRYPTALALAEDLERWLRHEPIRARPSSAWEHGVKWTKRHPSTAALLAVLALVTGTFGALAGTHYWRLHREQLLARQQAGDWQSCQSNLVYLGNAIHAFRQASNRMPDSLAELLPSVIRQANWLLCPSRQRGHSIASHFDGTDLPPTSYTYEFTPDTVKTNRVDEDPVPLLHAGMSRQEWRLAQTARYGAAVPLVRCGFHFPILNVSFAGEVFESLPNWIPEVAARANFGGVSPPGWVFAGWPAGQYDAALDTSVAHAGRASARLQSRSVVSGSQMETLQTLRAGAFRGRSVEFSIWLRSDSVTGYAELNLSARSPQNESLVEFKTNVISARGTTDWSRYSVAGRVPQTTEVLVLSVTLRGSGRMWMDDAALTVEGRIVPSMPALATNFFRPAPVNLDFETIPRDFTASLPGPPGTPRGWTADLWREGFHTGSDSNHAHTGRSSVRLESGKTGTTGKLWQNVPTDTLRRLRVRLSAWMKSERVESYALLWMKARELAGGTDLAAKDNRQHPVRGTTAWTRYEVELDVPASAKELSFGCQLTGVGLVWMDDVQVEIVQDGSTVLAAPDVGINLDFEQ